MTYTQSRVNPSGCGEYTQFYKDKKRVSNEYVCETLNGQEEKIKELETTIIDLKNRVEQKQYELDKVEEDLALTNKVLWNDAEELHNLKKDEPMKMEVIRLTDLLKNLALIKKHNFENTYCDERIYLCADYIEKELLKLRYNNNFTLEKDW